MDTVLCQHPTEGRSVGCLEVTGICLVDSLADSRVTESPSWAGARHGDELSGVLCFSVIIQSAHPALSLGD